MPTVLRRHFANLAVVSLILLLLGGCAGKATKSAAGQPAPQASTTTLAPTTTGPPPLTDAERAWIRALPNLDAKIQKAITASNNLTPTVLRSLAAAFRTCTLELQRIGLPSERLRPVYVLAKKGCGEFDKGAKCFATAAGIGVPFSGTPQARALDKAIDCGFKSQPKGADLLFKAVDMAEGIKVKVETG